MADPANSGSSVKGCRSNSSVTELSRSTSLEIGNSLKEEVISSDMREALCDSKSEIYNDFEVGKDSFKEETIESDRVEELGNREEVYVDFEAVKDSLKEEVISSEIKKELEKKFMEAKSQLDKKFGIVTPPSPPFEFGYHHFH